MLFTFLYGLLYNFNTVLIKPCQFQKKRGEKMNTEFPRIMTLRRKERKISQKQAAADLGISQALLSHYEKGIRECGLDFLVKAADYYNVSCDYLLGRTASPDEKFSPSDSTENICDDINTISESADILLSICRSADDKSLEKDAGSYIILNLYKLFRMLYHSNDENSSLFFKIPELPAEDLTDSVIMKACASIKLKCKENLNKSITTDSLLEEYSKTPSLMKLIKSSEDKISELYG